MGRLGHAAAFDASRGVRRGLSAGVLALALAAVVPAPAGAVSASQIAQVINQERAANGLPPVSLSQQLSSGNANHDNYERLNGSPSTGYDIRGEDPSKPGYTASGAQAGRNSLLADGDRSSSYVYANDDWAIWDVFDNAPNHLVELMDPAVATIGADQLDFHQPPYGTVHISSVDVRSAPLRPPPNSVKLYSYIGPFGRAPRSVAYVEGPTANRFSGPSLYVWFLKPAGVKLGLRSITLQQPDGTQVPAITTASGAFSSAPGGSADVRAVGGSGTPTWSIIPTPGLGPPSDPSASKSKQDAKKAEEKGLKHLLETVEDVCRPPKYVSEDDVSPEDCAQNMQSYFQGLIDRIDPADPNVMTVAVPRAAAMPRVPGCARVKEPARRRCPRIRTLQLTYLRALGAEASVEQAISVTLNRLSTASADGSQPGVDLQEAALYTLDGELATDFVAVANGGKALANALRRAGVHGQVPAAQLERVREALLRRDWRRFPKGVASFLRRQGITPADFSSVLRRAGVPPRPTRMDILAGFTASPATDGLDALYERLGPSGVGAIVSSLAAAGAISGAERGRLGADVQAATAATTTDQRQAATRAFVSDLAPIPNGEPRRLLNAAATGLTGSDGYTLVVSYTVNNRAQTARIPVGLG